MSSTIPFSVSEMQWPIFPTHIHSFGLPEHLPQGVRQALPKLCFLQCSNHPRQKIIAPLDTCINLTRSQVSRRLGPYSLTSICIPRYAQHRRNLSVHESALNPGDLHRKCQMCHCGKQQLTKLTCWVYKNRAIFCLSTQDNSLKWAIEKELFCRHSENSVCRGELGWSLSVSSPVSRSTSAREVT